MLSLSLLVEIPPSTADFAPKVQERLDRWAREAGPSFRFDGTQVDESGTRVHVWVDRGRPEVEIRLVEDPLARVRYLSASGPEDADRLALFRWLRSQFEGISIEQLKSSARSLTPDDPAVLLRLALGLNGNYDEASCQLLRLALQHSEPEIRASAAEAAALLRWPQLADDLHAALQRETEEDLRRLLTVATRQTARRPTVGSEL